MRSSGRHCSLMRGCTNIWPMHLLVSHAMSSTSGTCRLQWPRHSYTGAAIFLDSFLPIPPWPAVPPAELITQYGLISKVSPREQAPMHAGGRSSSALWRAVCAVLVVGFVLCGCGLLDRHGSRSHLVDAGRTESLPHLPP